MKCITILFSIFTFTNCYSRFELIISNNSSHNRIYVQVYPVGAIFNGDKKYTFECKYPTSQYHLIIGGAKMIPNIAPNNNFELNHDMDQQTGGTEAAIGYGRYRISFYSVKEDGTINYDSLMDYCDVDFSDYNYSYGGSYTADIDLSFYSQNDIRYWGGYLIPNERIIRIWDQRIRGLPLLIQNKKGFNSDDSGNPLYTAYPISAADPVFDWIHIDPHKFYLGLNINAQGTNFKSLQNIQYNDCELVLDNTIDITINSGSTLTFTSGSSFRTFQDSGKKTVTLGNNASIQMNPYSNVNLRNTIFQTTGEGATWKGLRLVDTGLDTISGCVFNHADTSLQISNSSECLSYNKKIITGSRFNNGTVRISNTFRTLISNDTFYSSDNEIYLLSVSNTLYPDELSACEESFPGFNNNIINNYFYGGTIQLFLNCLASQVTPFFIYSNTFAGTDASLGLGIVCNKISGDFRYNNFLTNDYATAVNLIQSNMNFYENASLKSGSNVTLSINSSSSARLAPLYSEGNFYWYGGYNKLISDEGDNLYVVGMSSVFLGKGGNCFSVNNSNKFHIHTAMTGSCNSHGITASDNYWSVITPLSLLMCNSSSVSLLFEPYRSSCPGAKADPVEFEINNREDGIFDSLFVTDAGDYIPGDREDENMFRKAISK